MSLRRIKLRTVAAMQSTVPVELRLPLGMTREQAIRALRHMVKGFRPRFKAGGGNG